MEKESLIVKVKERLVHVDRCWSCPFETLELCKVKWEQIEANRSQYLDGPPPPDCMLRKGAFVVSINPNCEGSGNGG